MKGGEMPRPEADVPIREQCVSLRTQSVKTINVQLTLLWDMESILCAGYDGVVEEHSHSVTDGG